MNLRNTDGSLTTSDEDTAEELNSHFQSVFVQELPLEDDGSVCGKSFSQGAEIRFDTDTVRKKLTNLKKDKSPGPDGIHPMLLQSTADTVAKPLAHIFAASFAQGLVPSDWRKANISNLQKGQEG